MSNPNEPVLPPPPVSDKGLVVVEELRKRGQLGISIHTKGHLFEFQQNKQQAGKEAAKKLQKSTTLRRLAGIVE